MSIPFSIQTDITPSGGIQKTSPNQTISGAITGSTSTTRTLNNTAVTYDSSSVTYDSAATY